MNQTKQTMLPSGESDLTDLLKTLSPRKNIGDFVFCVLDGSPAVNLNEVVMTFKEKEGTTVVLKKELADALKLRYTFVAGWITLTVHSSLAAVGLTAAFSKALSDRGISCNVVAAYFHDHIFVAKKDTDEAMKILNELSRQHLRVDHSLE
jgi:hypothetical protein